MYINQQTIPQQEGPGSEGETLSQAGGVCTPGEHRGPAKDCRGGGRPRGDFRPPHPFSIPGCWQHCSDLLSRLFQSICPMTQPLLCSLLNALFSIQKQTFEYSSIMYAAQGTLFCNSLCFFFKTRSNWPVAKVRMATGCR